MQKQRIAALLLTLALLLCAAPALAQSVSPIPADIDTQHLAHREYCAAIDDYDEAAHTVRVRLYQPEAFRAEEIAALAPGDTLLCDGETYTVKSVRFDEDGAACYINDGAEEFAPGTLMLGLDARSGAYTHVQESDLSTWLPAATLTLEVPVGLVLLDGIDPETGEPLDAPTLHHADDFVRMLTEYQQQETGVSFAASNVYLLFDENGLPVVVRRFYVPWQ